MKIKRILLIALIISGPVFAWYLAKNQTVLDSIVAQAEQPKIIFAFLCSTILLLCAHVLRALKTKFLTDSIKHTSWRTHTRGLFIGYLFNMLLPFRLGEIIRAFVIGKGIRMSSTFIFGLVLLDRALDGFILGSFGLFLLLRTNLFDSSETFNLVLFASSALILVSTLVISLLMTVRRQPAWLLKLWYNFTALLNDNLRDSMRFKMWSLMYGLERVLITKRLKRYVILSIGMWIVYIVATFPLIFAFVQKPSATTLAATGTVSYMGVSAPAGPSNVGSYGNFVEPFANANQDSNELHSALVFIWLLQVIPVFLIGLIFVLRTKETLQAPAASKSLQAIDDKLLRNVDITHDLGSFLEAFFTNNSLSRIMHRLEIDKNSKLIQYFKGGSNAVTALVYENDQFVVRKITPIQYKYKLDSQYEWLKDKEKLSKVVNVLSDEATDTYYKIDLEYNKEYIPFFDYIHSMPVKKSKEILSDVFSYLNKHIYKPDKQSYRPKDLTSYIENRCLSKIRQAAEVNDEIRSLLTYSELIINGEKYTNIPVIIDRLKRDKNISTVLATYRKCSVHGDPTIDNILATKDSDDFLFIDPNDNENEISGPVFDFGRMAQSLVYGYEFLCRDEQQVLVAKNHIDFEYSKSNNYEELAKHLEILAKKYLTEEEQQAVLFHAAMLYSRMLTHRVVINPLNAAKFYAVSVIAFNKFLDGLSK